MKPETFGNILNIWAGALNLEILRVDKPSFQEILDMKFFPHNF